MLEKKKGKTTLLSHSTEFVGLSQTTEAKNMFSIY